MGIYTNICILQGEVCRTGQIRFIGEKKTPKLEFSLKTVEHSNGRSFNHFHNIVVWGQLAEAMADLLHEGRFVFVRGSAKTESWEKDGLKQYKSIVEAIGCMVDQEVSSSPRREQGQQGHSQQAQGRQERPAPMPQDDIPF